jgi:hypothetical protein
MYYTEIKFESKTQNGVETGDTVYWRYTQKMIYTKAQIAVLKEHKARTKPGLLFVN